MVLPNEPHDDHGPGPDQRVCIVVPVLESGGQLSRSLDSLARQTYAAGLQVVVLAVDDKWAASVTDLWQGFASYAVREAELTSWPTLLPDIVDTEYFSILEPFDSLAASTIEHLMAATSAGGPDCVEVPEDAAAPPDESVSPQAGVSTETAFHLTGKLWHRCVLARVGHELLAVTTDPLSPRGLGLPFTLAATTTARVDGCVTRGSRDTRRVRSIQPESVLTNIEWARLCLSAARRLPDASRQHVALRVVEALGPVLSAVRRAVPEDAQTSFFATVQATLGKILTPATLAEANVGAAVRNALAAVSVASPDVFFGQYGGRLDIEVDNSSTYLLPDGVPDEWRFAFDVELLAAFVEYVDRGANDFQVAVILATPWARISPDSRITCSLRIAATTLAPIRGRWRLREEALRQPDHSAALFVCPPVSELPSGDHHLSLVLTDQRGSTLELRLGLTTGALRSSRRHQLGRLNWQLLPQHRPVFHAVLRITRSSLGWHARTAADLAQDLMHRSPYSRHRVLHLLLRVMFLGRQVWLIGERRDTAQDNGWVLFEYLSQHPVRGVSFYYLLDRASTKWGAAQHVPHVVAQNSTGHKLLWLAATHLVSSHDIDAFLLPTVWSPARYRQWLAPYLGAHRVFLQHGIIVNGVGPILRRGATGLSMFLCSCEDERRYLARHTRGYTNEQLKLCGLPRFDRLVSPPPRKQNVILVAPTWRRELTVPSSARRHDRLVAAQSFLKSTYYAFYSSLLTDPALLEALERNDFTLVFVPHYEFRDAWTWAGLESSRIRIIEDGGSSLADWLKVCRVFITDYSSTQFDAALAGASILYSAFDAPEFFSTHYRPGWFDQRKDGLGPVLHEPDDLTRTVTGLLDAQLPLQPLYIERVRRLNIVCDGQNCRRVVRAIRAVT